MKLDLKSRKTYIMGILNVTPDSFYDGGRYIKINRALRHVEQMLKDGADIIDVGGQSTRPFSEEIPVEEELNRVIPVIREIKKKYKVVVSLDSYRYDVIKASLDLGVDIINDIFALRKCENVIELLNCYKEVLVVLMHMKGTPKDMQLNPVYKDVVSEIKSFFSKRVKFLTSNGITNKRIILDPGIGFGKKTVHNMDILKNIEQFKVIDNYNYPLLIGLSRKSFIGKILGTEQKPLDVDERYEGTIVLNTYCALKGVNVLRVHDVRPTAQMIKLISKLKINI